MKFWAKPSKDVPLDPELAQRLDADGYIHGHYVDGFIVGPVVESTDEFINFEYWCPIDIETIQWEGK